MDASLRPFALSLARPMVTAAGTIEERRGVIVRVETDGVVGWGEATPLPGWTESLRDCRTALSAAFDRLGSAGPEAVLDDLTGTPAARHGVQLALADLEGRRDGQPLHRTLGGDGRVDAVPVNATLDDADVEATRDAAVAAADDGFACLKVKVGNRPVVEDGARIAAVRSTVGDDVGLRADANGAWTAAQARSALEYLAEAGVAYVEQPLARDDLAGLASLRGGPVGVAVDESLVDHAPSAVLEAGAADVVVLKPMVLGGLDRARAVADAAREAGAAAVVSSTVDGVLARTGAVHLAASLPAPRPAGLATAQWLVEDLGPDPAPVRDGAVRVPDGPGLGTAPETGS